MKYPRKLLIIYVLIATAANIIAHKETILESRDAILYTEEERLREKLGKCEDKECRRINLKALSMIKDPNE